MAPRNKTASLLRAAMVAMALLFVALFVFVALSRVAYPFDLEWTEGRMVDQVARLVEGKQIYVRPSLEFTPIGYTPLYYYVSAMAAKVVGIGYAPLRLVSFFSTLACFAFLFLIAWRESKSRTAGILAMGLYAATFVISGNFFDLARVDSLMMALLLAGIFTARFCNSIPGVLVTALLLSLAMLTKQTALLLSLPVLLFLLIRSCKQGLVAILAVGLIMGGATLLLDYLHEGWYNYFIFGQKDRGLRPGKWFYFCFTDMLLPLPIAIAAAVAFLASLAKERQKQQDLIFWTLLAGGMILTSLIGKWAYGGVNNNLFPAHAAVALLFALAWSELTRRFRNQSIVAMLFLAQFALLIYNPLAKIAYARLDQPLYNLFMPATYKPSRMIPTDKDRAAGEHLIATIRSFKGEVWLTAHGYMSGLAEKQTFAPSMGYLFNDDVQKEVQEEIRQAIKTQRFDAIIMNQHSLPEEWKAYYELQGPVFTISDSFYPPAGWPTRPRAIFIPRVLPSEGN